MYFCVGDIYNEYYIVPTEDLISHQYELYRVGPTWNRVSDIGSQ